MYLKDELLIRGVEVNYFFVCKTKLWYFMKNINMEHESDLVSLGKLLHKRSYFNEEKEVLINSIKIDFIKNNQYLEIHEVKKSKTMEKAHEMQALYYLYYLKNLGIKGVAKINYPKLKVVKEVRLEGKENYIEEVINEIEKIRASKKPPKPDKKKICKNCAYYELCYI